MIPYPELKQLCEKHNINCAPTKEADVYLLLPAAGNRFELNLKKGLLIENIFTENTQPGSQQSFKNETYYENLESELRRISNV